jgi:uncharacterized protein
MASIKGKLNRLKKHMENLPTNEQIKTPVEQFEHERKEVPFLQEWTNDHTFPEYFEDEYCLVRRKKIPISTLHGKHRFAELKQVVEQWNESRIDGHPLSSNGLTASDLLFFDTETTGLGGGTGNLIFMLGLARVLEKDVEVTQYVLPGPSSETALYHHFLSDVKELKNLVTYNGKAFDWPQVKTRHTLIRDTVPKLPSFGHFDLLHASRRLWKNDLESVRLSIVESEILQVVRNDDTPGFLAPMIYFDFLKDPNPIGMKGILKHNETDVLSLITLYIHLSSKILNMNDSHITWNEKYEIGRWYEALGLYDLASSCYQHCIQSNTNVALKAKKALAFLNKRLNKIDESISLFKELFEIDKNNTTEIAIELAKYYEHKEKDLEKAYHYSCKGLQVLKETNKIYKVGATKEQQSLTKRINRLQMKMGNREV